jgi:hypothetical protein
MPIRRLHFGVLPLSFVFTKGFRVFFLQIGLKTGIIFILKRNLEMVVAQNSKLVALPTNSVAVIHLKERFRDQRVSP